MRKDLCCVLYSFCNHKCLKFNLKNNKNKNENFRKNSGLRVGLYFNKHGRLSIKNVLFYCILFYKM